MAVRPIRWKRVLSGVLLVIVLGVVANGIWDVVAKPGLTRCGRVCLDTITLGSEAIKDATYSSAALNPNPIPSLVLFVLLSTLPPCFLAWLLLDWLVKPTVVKRVGLKEAEKEIAAISRAADSDEARGRSEKLQGRLLATARRLRRLLRMLRFLLAILLVFVCVASYLFQSVANEAIAIWRVFNANVSICIRT